MTQEGLRKKHEALKGKIARLDYICSGSVMLLYRKCGKPTCGCKDSKKAEHGPYHIWTRKVMGKTVTRTLSEEQAKRCRQYIDNLKNLEVILEAIKSLSAQIVEQK